MEASRGRHEGKGGNVGLQEEEEMEARDRRGEVVRKRAPPGEDRGDGRDVPNPSRRGGHL